ncbi:hypothetical protein AC1031_003831 [Aphanomyces cochlioides]|nr:hypothetical protein AC1031_003831 [Aphanomyces cochlioides]
MPSTTTHHGLVCAGISSSIESKKARRSVIPAKKPLNFGTDVSKLVRPKSNTSPRTEEDVDKLVQVLRHSLQLNKVELPVCNNGTPPVVKRRVYPSPRERIQSVTSQLSMSVMGTSPGLRPSTEKLPSLTPTPSIESTLSPGSTCNTASSAEACRRNQRRACGRDGSSSRAVQDYDQDRAIEIH